VDSVTKKIAVTTTGTGNGGNGSVDANGRLTYLDGKPVFSKADIKELAKLAKDQYYDSRIVDFVKLNTNKAWLYTEDVILFLAQLYYDSYKLELAKALYSKVIDKHRFYKLAASFYYESYYRQLQDYIGKQ